MSEPSRKRLRMTPRNSVTGATVATAASETPFNDLHQLGKVIHKPNTPQHRTPPGPPSTAKTTNTARTPNKSSLTPTIRSATRFAVRRGPPTTPHAIRALRQRRNAAITPSRDRRRSGRVQRETPREDLRKLSRLMAKHSKPLEPSPQVEVSKKIIRASFLEEEDEENEPPPRLSMPLNEDEDSWHEAPPRLSLPLDGDETQTVRSVEGARRALFDRQRDSGGNLSFMDRTAALLDEIFEEESEREEEDPRPVMGGGDVTMDGDLEPIPDGEATGELRAMLGNVDQVHNRQVSPSEGVSPLHSDGDPTFQFRFPERRQSAIIQPRRDEELEEPGAHVQGEAAVNGDDLEEDDDSETEKEVAVLTSTRNIIPAAAPNSPGMISKPSRKVPTKELKISKHGLQYSSLPSSVVKRVATTFSRSYTGNFKLSKETLLAIEQASDWFFEQVSEDVTMYSDHAGRRTIEESDVVTLMGRQKLVGKNQTVFSLAQKFLPRELVGEIRIRPTKGKKRGKKRNMVETIAEEEEEETTA